MKTFEESIKPYESLKETYESAMKSALKEKLKGDELDFFLSKHCRAYFFFNHLRVEREASDWEIRDVNKAAIVPFELSDIQMARLDEFEKRMLVGRKFKVRVMKCRRARVSTIYLAICYHIARFNENKKGLCFCDRLETSRKLRRILDIFYQNDDLSGKPEIGKKTLCEGLYLHPKNAPKGSTDRDSFILLGSGEQANSGIGGSLDFMHWSEAALTKDANTHRTTISPSLQGALFDVAESTPSLTGQDEIIYPEFEHKSDNCDTSFISWMDVKDYCIEDKALMQGFMPHLDHNLYGKEAEVMVQHNCSIGQMLWRRFKLDEIGNLNAFRHVFPISIEEAFYASAGLFFHKDIIEMCKPKENRKPTSFSFSDQGIDVSAIVDDAGAWKLFEKREIDARYLITCDIAEGKCADKELRDGDYSVAMVFKLTSPMVEVAIIRDRLPVEIFAEQVAVVARYYNGAHVIPERNAAGLGFLVRILQLYSNVYRQQNLRAGSFTMTQEYGFQTTSSSKLYALSCLLSQIRDSDKGLKINSDIVRTEMGKFAQTGVRYGAMAGFHDDTITCLWLAAICVSQTPSLLRRSVDLNRQYVGSVGNVERPIQRENAFLE